VFGGFFCFWLAFRFFGFLFGGCGWGFGFLDFLCLGGGGGGGGLGFLWFVGGGLVGYCSLFFFW